jgi:hypothetical protein
MTGANLKPWPLPPQKMRTLAWSGWRSRMKLPSGLFS